jgi:hypothetical protein
LGQVALYIHFEAARRITRFLQLVNHAFGVVGPAVFGFIGHVMGQDADCRFKIGGNQFNEVVVPFPEGGIGSQAKGTGEHVAAVVVGMLANQVYPARRIKKTGWGPFAEGLKKTVLYFLQIHIYSAPSKISQKKCSDKVLPCQTHTVS